MIFYHLCDPYLFLSALFLLSCLHCSLSASFRSPKNFLLVMNIASRIALIYPTTSHSALIDKPFFRCLWIFQLSSFIHVVLAIPKLLILMFFYDFIVPSLCIASIALYSSYPDRQKIKCFIYTLPQHPHKDNNVAGATHCSFAVMYV